MRDSIGTLLGFLFTALAVLFCVYVLYLFYKQKIAVEPPAPPAPTATPVPAPTRTTTEICEAYAEAYLKKYKVEQEIKRLEDEQSTLIAKMMGKLSDEDTYELLRQLKADREALEHMQAPRDAGRD